MKKLTIKLSILLLPIGSLVLALNIIVDPANLLSGDIYVENIAKILAKGNNVDNVSNYDERLLQKHFLQKKTSQHPDIIILGSSRVMEIGSQIFPGKTLYNIGVSHANINDLIALTGLLDSLKIYPKEVLINVDPFLLNKELNSNEWETLKEYHTFFLNKHTSLPIQSISKTTLKKYYTLVTFDYFTSSLQYLFKGNTKNIVDVGKAIPKKYGRLSNGCVSYSYDYQHPDTLLVCDIAKNTSKQVKLKVPDNYNLKLMQNLIGYFKSKKIKCTFIMVPYHKSYYDAINNEQFNLFNKYESFYINLAKINKVQIKGSFSPSKCKLINSDFYDTYHCSGIALTKIFNNTSIK